MTSESQENFPFLSDRNRRRRGLCHHFHRMHLLHGCRKRNNEWEKREEDNISNDVFWQGGIKAVMWTDTFQAAVMFGSFLAVIIKGNADTGGSNKVFDLNYQTGRIELFK